MYMTWSRNNQSTGLGERALTEIKGGKLGETGWDWTMEKDKDQSKKSGC